MGMVQIEESELVALRQERNEARTKVDEHSNTIRGLTTKVETAEVAQKKAEDEKATADKKASDLEENAQRATLRDKRIGELGQGFTAKLGEFSKSRLTELAGTCSEEEWDNEVKEREEMAGVKRDDKGDGTTPAPASAAANGATAPATSSFASEEVASFMRGGVGTAPGTSVQDGTTSVRQLARAFGKKTAPAGAGK